MSDEQQVAGVIILRRFNEDGGVVDMAYRIRGPVTLDTQHDYAEVQLDQPPFVRAESVRTYLSVRGTLVDGVVYDRDKMRPEDLIPEPERLEPTPKEIDR